VKNKFSGRDNAGFELCQCDSSPLSLSSRPSFIRIQEQAVALSCPFLAGFSAQVEEMQVRLPEQT
jgi:hypothetical protein